MFVRASLGSALLFLTAACAGRSGVSTRPLNPEDGPKATIRATVSGPAVYRQLEANFWLEQPGYALVGHLGGDGMIRVIYPKSPGDRSERVAGRKWIRTDGFDAPYDFAPQLYRFTSEPVRSASAAFDSYDGRGHGYIFVITSHQPLDMAPLMDGFEFGELDIKDYSSMLDPRVAVHRVADAVAGRGNYTLKFANSFSTHNYASVNSFGCRNTFNASRFGGRYYDPFYFGVYDNLDVMPLFAGSWGMPSWYLMSWESPRLGHRCGGGYAMSYYRVLFVPGGVNNYPWTGQIGFGGGGTTPITPILTRLRPMLSDAGSAVQRRGRSAIDRHTIVTRARPSAESNELNAIVERLLRPERRALAGVSAPAPVRTHASSFNRPGPTRVFNENSYRRHAFGPYYPVAPRARQNDFFDVMRDRPSTSFGSSSSSGSSSSGTTSSGSSGSTSTATSSGGSAAATTEAATGRRKQ